MLGGEYPSIEMHSSGAGHTNTVDRRSFLGAAGTLAGVGIAGCLGGAGGPAAIRVLAAGSLAHTFEDHVAPAFTDETGHAVHGEYYGANAVMRMVEDRTKHPDVIVSADATLLRDRLYDEFTDWDLEFATNSVGLAYNAETAFGQALEDGEPWYEQATGVDAGDLAIGDPNLDPLGYRAVQAFDLAEAEYGLSDFRDRLIERVYEEPDEPQLTAGVEAGSRAGAVVYRNMAVDHGLPFLEFPDAYNFAVPELADHYATVSFTTEDGYTAVGRPVVYNATVNAEADSPAAGRQFVGFLGDNPELLVDAGLTVGDALPRAAGNVPEAFEG